MTSVPLIMYSLLYLAVLFVIADRAERRGAATGRSVVSNPYVYALSLAVYCTAWTFYGSVGKAASDGIEFLAVYIGPTLTAPLWWLLLRKIIRICKRQGITSIADFISARYGKSRALGVLVTLFSILGIIPYMSIQIKAVAGSFATLTGQAHESDLFFLSDRAFLLTLLLALFAILFGTRKLEATERHEGLVATIAFESLVKLVAFVAVGAFVTFGLFNGPGDIFRWAARVPSLRETFRFGPGHTAGDWFWQCLISGFAMLFLPRQFQVAVVENVDEAHLNKAMWLFPLYLFVINLFVLPIAFGGQLLLGASASTDEYVLALPLRDGQLGLAILTYLGGFSAATSMIIVETTALSVMISNNLVMPLLLTRARWQERWGTRPGPFVLNIRRLAILGLLLLAYLYYRIVANRLSLVSVGMISFSAVAQFAPAMIGGLFWKRGSRVGARLGLLMGSSVWLYTLILPTLVPTVLPQSLLTDGPFGLGFLNPEHLLGMQQYDPISHSVFWSLLVNTGFYIGGSLRQPLQSTDINQAVLFVDVFRLERTHEAPMVWKGTSLVTDIHSLLATFFGEQRAGYILDRYNRRHQIDPGQPFADPRLVAHVERLLSGAVGAASARILVASVAKEEPITTDGVIEILKSSQTLLAANRQLTRQSIELQQLTRQLREANELLKTADQQKDEFLSTVTHELRTPITSIRALAEILYDDDDDLDPETRQRFLSTIIRESERLTRLINQVLELERIESGRTPLQFSFVSMNDLVKEAADSIRPLATDKHLLIKTRFPLEPIRINADRDGIMQVLINLISNAVKFSPDHGKPVVINLSGDATGCSVQVIDQGVGIEPAYHEQIFEKFYQANGVRKPKGSGLGLTISRTLIERHGGTLIVDSRPSRGSVFSFYLPQPPAGSVETNLATPYTA